VTAGNQAGTAGGFHTVQSNWSSADRVGTTALGDGKDPLAQRTADLMTDTGNGFAVEVGLRERLEHHSTVGGGVAQSDNVFH